MTAEQVTHWAVTDMFLAILQQSLSLQTTYAKLQVLPVHMKVVAQVELAPCQAAGTQL